MHNFILAIVDCSYMSHFGVAEIVAAVFSCYITVVHWRIYTGYTQENGAVRKVNK
jgi:hypothetical protein